MNSHSHLPTQEEFSRIFRRLLSPESPYYRIAILLSAFISLLTLAVPISIQMLIDQVANTALMQPVILLAGTLFGLLAISGLFYAAREYVLELFARRIFARLASEITLKIVNSPASFFDQARRDDLINRYFDIMTVTRSIPPLLVGLFTFMFQSAIGFAVTSLYHPIFLLFNAVLIAALYAIWKIWGWRATEHAFHKSEAKYDAAAWIEGLSHNTEFFKAGPNGDDAIRKTNKLIDHHISMMKGYFRVTFTQMLLLLLLYALSSAALLGLGGWLVIEGQLSLGQLVAAELILSAIFGGFVMLAGYMKDYYDLCAAVEELDRIQKIPSRLPPRADRMPDGGGAVLIKDAYVAESDYDLTLNFEMAVGSSLRVAQSEPLERRTLTRLLKGHITATSGRVEVDGIDVRDWHHQTLNGEVKIIDRTTLPHMPIGTYVQHGHPEIDRAHVFEAIDIVGLTERVSKLPHGIDTIIAPSGWPLTVEESLRLKLAAAILDAPRLVILSEVYDLVKPEPIMAAIKEMRKNRQVSVLILRENDDLEGFKTSHIEVGERLHPSDTLEMKA
ncbi:MAG: ABC transporter transmembrane domain-containing protein [Oceanicoccus sp.]